KALFARCPALCGFAVQNRAGLPKHLDKNRIPDADLFVTEVGIFPKLDQEQYGEIYDEITAAISDLVYEQPHAYYYLLGRAFARTLHRAVGRFGRRIRQQGDPQGGSPAERQQGATKSGPRPRFFLSYDPMPANLSPEYKQAEQAYRAAREPGERLDLLKEMLRTIPKHKGTEHLQADIKSRIKELGDELVGPKKGGARGSPFAVRREGAAQVCLVGPPNAGKSTLHAALTRSHSEIGPFPYTTRLPVPGMLPFKDIAFQLVDLPPLSGEHFEPGVASVLQGADAAWLVVDLSDPACTEQVAFIRDALSQRRIVLDERW